MSPETSKATSPSDKLSKDLLAAFDNVFGLHPGFRPAHAKGLFCTGSFVPTAAAKALTRAPHAARPSTPVVVRFSDSAGVPEVPDNDPAGASPRGIAIRFQLADHVHTDIIGHSFNGFPARTGEEFLEFLRTLPLSGPDAPKPKPVEMFLSTHPQTMHFVTTPKPIPTSFAREAFFGINAFRFTNAAGASCFGRFKIRPEAGTEYLSSDEAAKKSANFLFDEISQRLAKGPIKFRVVVQIAADEDDPTDATTPWPESRPEIEFGTVALTERENEMDPDLHKIIFDPVPRVDGIDPSGDPLIEVRSSLYLLSGRRRRAASPK